MKLPPKKALLLGAAAVAAAAFAVSSRGGGAEIGALHPYRGPIRESFREPGKTRLENTWRIATQVAGRVSRIQLEPGDRVTKGQALAEYDLLPFEKSIAEAEATVQRLHSLLEVMDDNSLEQNSLAEAKETAQSAKESASAAQARLTSARTRVEHAARELKRITELAAAGGASRSQLDDAQFASDTAQLDLKNAEAALAAEKARARASGFSPDRFATMMQREKLERKEVLAQIAQAEASLERARHDRQLAAVVSPIDGVVLERFERGEKPMMAGQDLLLLGNPAEIEVVADILTQDALKLKIGGEVELEPDSGLLKLAGKVKRIEPQGFTKLSSLGVEQQRVNVIVALENPPSIVGVGFRLYARFYTGEKPDALLAPRFSVLQAPDQSYYVLAIVGGKLAKRPVRLGLRSDLELEILEGLAESDLIVAAPDSTMAEGSPVTPVLKPR